MWRQEGVRLHARQQLLLTFHTDAHQHYRMMGIGNDLLDDLVAALMIGIGEANGRRIGVNIFKRTLEIALFFVDEGHAVGQQELHIAGLRTIDGGIVDFVQDAMRDGVPDAAGSRIRHANCVFSAGSPAGLCSG